jgi:FHS family L-fucose permease-like MFS transporter
MGLGCFLFYPAADFRIFGVFLLAMFVLAGGITILQVAANPYVAALGPESSASSRLNLSQAFNSLGTFIAPLVSAAFILSSSVLSSKEVSNLSSSEQEAYYVAEAAAVQSPFLILAGVIILLAIIFAVIKLPKILEGDEDKNGSYKIALKTRHLMLGAVGIFVYVGAEVTIGSYMVNYFLTLDIVELIRNSGFMPGLAELLSGTGIDQATPAQLAGSFVALYWGGAMVGRFIGSGLQLIIKPSKLLTLYGLINVGLLFITMNSSGLLAVWTVLCIGLFNSIMFPTIFILAIKGLGPLTGRGSGLLCQAIVGGAIIPMFQGIAADATSVQASFIVPAFAYVYIAWYALKGSKNTNNENAVEVKA